MSKTIQHEEEIAPTDELVAPLQTEVGIVTPAGKQFLDAEFVGNLFKRLLGVADRKRHQDAARPRGYLVDVEPEPCWEKDDFRRDRGHGVVIVLAEEAKIDFGEGVDRSHAAKALDALARAFQNRIIGLVASELEAKIGLHRGAHI